MSEASDTTVSFSMHNPFLNSTYGHNLSIFRLRSLSTLPVFFASININHAFRSQEM